MTAIVERIGEIAFSIDFDLEPAVERWDAGDEGYRSGPYLLRLERRAIRDGSAVAAGP